MAKRPNRYTEARMYLVGGSVGLLLIVWSVLAMKDLARSTTTSAPALVVLIPPTEAPVATPLAAVIPPPAAPVTTPLAVLIPPAVPDATSQPAALVPLAAPDATSQPAAASSDSSSGGSTAVPQVTAEPTATASPRPTPKPQTRSRGS